MTLKLNPKNGETSEEILSTYAQVGPPFIFAFTQQLPLGINFEICGQVFKAVRYCSRQEYEAYCIRSIGKVNAAATASAVCWLEGATD